MLERNQKEEEWDWREQTNGSDVAIALEYNKNTWVISLVYNDRDSQAAIVLEGIDAPNSKFIYKSAHLVGHGENRQIQLADIRDVFSYPYRLPFNISAERGKEFLEQINKGLNTDGNRFLLSSKSPAPHYFWAERKSIAFSHEWDDTISQRYAGKETSFEWALERLRSVLASEKIDPAKIPVTYDNFKTLAEFTPAYNYGVRYP